MPISLLVAIELFAIASVGAAVILGKLSASRRAARIRVTVDKPQQKVKRIN